MAATLSARMSLVFNWLRMGPAPDSSTRSDSDGRLVSVAGTSFCTGADVIFWIGLLPPTLLIGFMIAGPRTTRNEERTDSATTFGRCDSFASAADRSAGA